MQKKNNNDLDASLRISIVFDNTSMHNYGKALKIIRNHLDNIFDANHDKKYEDLWELIPYFKPNYTHAQGEIIKGKKQKKRLRMITPKSRNQRFDIKEEVCIHPMALLSTITDLADRRKAFEKESNSKITFFQLSTDIP